MPGESQIPIASQAASKRFAARLALFYGTLFGMMGTHLPFFPVWLKAVGIDAVVDRDHHRGAVGDAIHVLPFVTGLAERRQSLRGAIIVTAFATALGFLGDRNPASAAAGVSRLSPSPPACGRRWCR